MMRRIALIVEREFVTTVANKGFLIGLLVMPSLIAVGAVVGPRLLRPSAPQVRGDVAIIDPTGRVLPGLRTALDPASISARRAEDARRAAERIARGTAQAFVARAADANAIAPPPALRLLERSTDADVDAEKAWLLPPVAADSAERPLALVVVHADAVTRHEGGRDYGGYDLYISPSLDGETEGVVHQGVQQSIVNARLEASNLNRATVEATMRVDRPTAVIVAPRGEQRSARAFTRALPFIMGIMLFLAIMIGGQTLMTSLIEEKSSRVVEVLLAAVSPVELMAGKLLGQLSVGLLVMGVYVGVSILGLYQFALLGLLDPLLVLYLFVFFLLSYLVFGALMSAIGAAVNQMADAQSLMGPVMLLLIAPYVLTPFIGRAPNSTFSVAASFIPPINTFAMLARLASDSPPPAWQVWLTVAVGLAAAAAAVWFAAKVFKIGLLLHGKPPNFATLLRWARMA